MCLDEQPILLGRSAQGGLLSAPWGTSDQQFGSIQAGPSPSHSSQDALPRSAAEPIPSTLESATPSLQMV